MRNILVIAFLFATFQFSGQLAFASQAKESIELDTLSSSSQLSFSLSTSFEEVPLPECIRDIPLTIHGVGLFRSYGCVGYTLTTLTWSRWSHSAMLLRDTTKAEDDPTGFYCFEVQTDPDNPKGDLFVQLNPWKKVIEKYKGTIAQRFIKYKENAPDSKDVKSFIQEFLNRPFKKNYCSFVKTYFGWQQKKDEEAELKMPLCSELVAHMLTRFGFLPQSSIACNFVTKHFSSERNLRLIGGASWKGKEVIVKE